MPSFWLEHAENGQNREFSFQSAQISIGRDKGSDFVLDHPTVSRAHALIRHQHGGFYLIVLSKGGMTALDGQQVHGEVALYDGSVVHIGQLEFRFRSREAAPRPGAQYGGGAPMGAGFGGQGFGGAPSGGSGNQMAPQQGFGAAPSGFANPGAAQQGFGGQGFGGQGFGNQGFGNQGFGQGAPAGAQGGFGAPAGFSGAPTQQPAGMGQFPGSTPGFGTPASGLPVDTGPSPLSAPMGLSPAAGGAGHQSKPEKSAASEAGIVSWDEIARSSEAMGDGPADKPQTLQERLAAKKDEKTNPMLVVFAGAMILGLVYFTFFMGDDDAVEDEAAQVSIMQQATVEIKVSCLGASGCQQKAQQAYAIGKEKIEQKTIAIPNLFEGYKKMMEAEAYLQKAGNATPPPAMADYAKRRDQARLELDEIWRNYHVRFNQAKKLRQYQQMVNELNAMMEYFPDRTARENRWAVAEARKMKDDGVYPASLMR